MTISKFFEIYDDVELKIWREGIPNVHITAALYNPIYVAADTVCSEREIEHGIETLHYSFISEIEKKLNERKVLENLIKRAKEEE